MSLYYSPSTKGFYHEDFHAEEIQGCNIPTDAVEITEEYHRELFDGIAMGQQIVINQDGFPVLQDHIYTLEEQAEITLHTMNDSYQQEINSPVEFKSADGTTHNYQASTAGIVTLQNWITVGQVPTGFFWKSADNEHVTFTVEDCKGLVGAILTRNFMSFQKLQNIKDLITAANTVEEYQKIVW